MMKKAIGFMKFALPFLAVLMTPVILLASEGSGTPHANLTHTAYGIIAVNIFILAYCFVPFENKIHLRKSKPVILAAGLIWVLVSIAYRNMGMPEFAHDAIKHSLVEYAELFLFLLAAMTYINSMEERNVFERLRAYLINRRFSLRKIFWVTGLLAFFISPIADNLTTALLMGAVAMAVGRGNKTFVALACINIVVAANAGGAFSPFGDITTLMVWQKKKVEFGQFFWIFIPSVVNWLVPALVMSRFVSKDVPEVTDEEVKIKRGGLIIIGLFLMTIVTAVSFHNFLHLPPAAGMMLGLGYLGVFSYRLKIVEGRAEWHDTILGTRRKEMLNPITQFIERHTRYIDDIIAHMEFPAFAIDENHNITHWNAAMEELTGVPASERIGTNKQWSPFYEEPRPAMADMMLDSFPEYNVKHFYEGKHRRNVEVEDAYDAVAFYPTIGENGKWISISSAPIKGQSGKIHGAVEVLQDMTQMRKKTTHFDLMEKIARAEWDTLLFFYGLILCIGGLSQFGYMTVLSQFMYADLGPTIANTLVGFLSAIVDNIPVMYAVLTMDPPMHLGQWLLVTLTAGVGGSMLSVGSAAGVALMGTARGTYTFGAHLKWTPVIMLGYGLSILCHLLLNAHLM